MSVLGATEGSRRQRARTYNIDDSGEGPADVVKGDPDIHEAEVVERDHAHKHETQRQHLRSLCVCVFVCL